MLRPEKSLLGSGLCSEPLPLVPGTPELCSVLGGAPRLPPPLRAEQPQLPQPLPAAEGSRPRLAALRWAPAAPRPPGTWEPRTGASAPGAASPALNGGAGSPLGLPAARGLVPPGTASLLCLRDTPVSTRPLGPWLSPSEGGVSGSASGTSILSCPVCQKPPWPRSHNRPPSAALPQARQPLTLSSPVSSGAQSPPRGTALACASGWHCLVSLPPLTGSSWAQLGTAVHTPLLARLPRAKDRKKKRLAV